MSEGNGGLLVVLALLTAFAVSFVAVAQHVRCVSLGYNCDRAERRQRELLRRRALARGRLARQRAPALLLLRAEEFGLGLGYPAPDVRAAPVEASVPSLVASIGSGGTR